MKIAHFHLLAICAVTALAATSPVPAKSQGLEQAVPLEGSTQTQTSAYRNRFGISARTRNAHRIAAELARPATDEPEQCACPNAPASDARSNSVP